MEPKYYAFCFGDWTPYSLSENMTGFLGYIMFNVCESLLIEVSSRIHGSGIFTYINGWFLWYVWVNIPCMDPMGITTLYNIYLGNWKKSCMFRLYRGLYYLGKEAIINIIRIYKPTSMIECQQVFFFRGWFVPTDLLPRFFGSVSYVLSLSGDGFCQRPRPPSPVLHLCIVPFGRPGSFSVLKTESRFGQKNRWLVNVSWAWKTRQDVETFRRKD